TGRLCGGRELLPRGAQGQALLFPCGAWTGGQDQGEAGLPALPGRSQRFPALSRQEEGRMTWLAIAVGGALGALSRYWVYNAFLKLASDRFPYATFSVNVAGSFLIGLAFVLITEQVRFGPE